MKLPAHARFPMLMFLIAVACAVWAIRLWLGMSS